MKTNRTLTSKHSAPLLTAALGLLLAVGAGRLTAADGIWATPADGLWSNGASWIGGVVADGPDATAYFTNDLGANVVVHLDSARTNGNLVFGDGNTGTGGNWVIDNNGVAANILRLIGTAPTITVGALGAGQLVNVSAVMTGNNLTETGPGLFVPSGANTYSNLVINGGRVVFTTPNGNGSLGASTTNNIITLTNGATLIRSNVANNLLFSMNIKGTNTLDATGAASGNLNGVFFGDGTLNMILPPGTASLTTGGNNPWNSNVWSYFTGTIILSGGGNLRFDCNNGATTLFGSKFATFDLGETNAMNERGAAAIVPHTTFIGALRGGSGTTISANSKAGDTNTLQIGDKGLDTLFSGRINNPAVTTFTAFTKSGAGTLTLAGTNGYSGVTVVQNGRLALLLAGSISNTPTITTITPGIFDVSDYAGTWVNNLGQTLGGNGVVTGSVSMASGFISPGIGTNVGRLTFANDLSIAGTMTNLIKTAFGNTNDSVRVLGNLNLSDVTTVQIVPPTGAALIPNGTYVLFQWSGALSGNLGNLTLAYAAQAIGASITLTTNVSKQIVLTVSGNNAGAVTWRGDGAGNVWDHTTPNWKTGGGGTTVFSELDGVTFDDSGFNTPAVSITEIVTPSSVVINLTNKDYVFAGGGGKITGVTGLTKNGPGKLTVTVDNDNSGPTMINGGTVQVGVGGVTGFLGSGGLVNNGTLVYNRSDPITLATPLQGSGSTVFDGTNSSLLLTGDSVNPGTLVAKAGTIQLGDGTSLHGTFTGVITNNATLRYFYNGDVNIPNTLSGSGVVNYDTSSGSRTYTIPVNVTNSTFNGTLNISPGIRLHASDGNGGYPFGNGGQVNVPDLAQAWLDRSATNYNQAFFIAGNGWSGDNADPALRLGAMRVFNTTVTGPVTLTGNARIGGSINATTITGPVSGGAFQLDVYGSNPESFILNLAPATGVNNWGATVITGGTLSILNSNGLSTNGLTMTGLGRFRLNGNSIAIASLAGGAPVNGTNALILNMSTTSSATLIVGSDGTTTFFDGLFGNGASQPLGLTKVGAGTLFLSGINTNTGPVTVNGGTLQLMNDGSFSNSTLLAVGAGAFLDVTIRNDASLNLNNGQTLSGSGTVNGTVNALLGSTINPGSSVGTLNVNGNLNLAGTLLMELNRSTVPNSDRLNVSGATVYGGTLATTNIGAALQVNDTFQLFPSGVSGFTSFNFATHDANNKLYTWQNNITTLGSIKVLSVTNAVNNTPAPITFSSSGGSLDLSWPADHTGWTLQTNASALTNTNGWFEYPAGTGSRDTNHVVIPISSSSPQVYFRLRLP